MVCFAHCCLPYQIRVVRADFPEEKALELRMNEEEPAPQVPRRAVQAKGIAKCEGSTVQIRVSHLGDFPAFGVKKKPSSLEYSKLRREWNKMR